MKLFAPEYYKEFKCIADKCTHSCCVGWEIDIDKSTMKKYIRMKKGYGKEIKNSIELTDTPHFKLSKSKKCPHLDSNGLCNIIINCGERYLCDICREHPRFYNFTNYGKEIGLGMSCQEACRIILASDNYDKQIALGRARDKIEKIEFDSTLYRKRLYEILKDQSISYIEKLRAIYKEFKIAPSIIDNISWQKRIDGLEYLDISHKELFKSFSYDLVAQPQYEKQLERALAYLIYRHCTEAFDENEHRIALGFCLFCERLLASMLNTNKEHDIIALAVILSEEIEYSTENTEKIKALIEEKL